MTHDKDPERSTDHLLPDPLSSEVPGPTDPVSDADLEAENFLDDWTSLHFAVMSASPEVVKGLLDRGADVDEKDANGDTPLHVAARSGRAKVTALLLDCGANIDAKNNNGETPLHEAARVNVVNVLTDRGADLEAKDTSGRTALCKAAMLKRVKVVTLLADLGADLEAKDASGQTALFTAAMLERVEVMNLLADLGANVDAKDSLGQTALFTAASLKRAIVVILLADRGANLNAQAGCGETALHRAASVERLSVVNLLLDLGAEIDARDAYGKTALHEAASSGRAKVAAMLLDRGANIDAKDANDSTPLHDAASSGHAQVVNLLLDRGADLDSFGEYLIRNEADRDDDITSLLRARGMAVDPTNGQGRTSPSATSAQDDGPPFRVLESISRSDDGKRVAVGCLLLFGLLGAIGVVSAIGDWLFTPSRVASDYSRVSESNSSRSRPVSRALRGLPPARPADSHAFRSIVVTLATWKDPITPTLHATRTLFSRGDAASLRTRYSDGTSHTQELIERPSGKRNERRFDVEPDNDQSEYFTVTDSGVVRWFAWDGTNFLTQRASRIHADFLALGANPTQRDCIPKQLSPTAMEIVALYEKLQGFKDDPSFADFGFSVGGPYNQWIEDATLLAESPPDQTAALLDQLGFTGGDVMNLGFSYLNPEVEEEKRNILDSEGRMRAGLARATCDSSVSP